MISVDLKGASDALETLAEIIIPWRKKNAERMRKLEFTQKQSEIHRSNAETIMTQAKIERERLATELDKKQSELIVSQAKKLEAEAKLIHAQSEKAMLEADKERAELRQSQIKLAMEILERYAPTLDDLEKMDYMVNQLLPVINHLTMSEIEPQFKLELPP
jgi:hypothetical protein